MIIKKEREGESPFKGRFFGMSKIVEKIVKCLTSVGRFRIFKSALIVKK
jgi:hypothetical protein